MKQSRRQFFGLLGAVGAGVLCRSVAAPPTTSVLGSAYAIAKTSERLEPGMFLIGDNEVVTVTGFFDRGRTVRIERGLTR